jgi:hypothetical protein
MRRTLSGYARTFEALCGRLVLRGVGSPICRRPTPWRRSASGERRFVLSGRNVNNKRGESFTALWVP